MNSWMIFLLVVYPYICLTLFLGGLAMRYVSAPGEWNARSSELLERRWLRIGSMFFHYGILFSLGGHIAGLLTPEALLRSLGISEQAHLLVASTAGQVIAPAALLGLVILLWRRLCNARVAATTIPTDLIIVGFIMINILTGGYQSFTEHYPALTNIGAWIRSVLTFRPDPGPLVNLPWFLCLHLFSGMTIFALAPFTRLVHIFSAPLTYVMHPSLTYRRRYGDL